jgi:hypothetical protein
VVQFGSVSVGQWFRMIKRRCNEIMNTASRPFHGVLTDPKNDRKLKKGDSKSSGQRSRASDSSERPPPLEWKC